jgi:RNA polymerase sigma factor (sigma-70 family)
MADNEGRSHVEVLLEDRRWACALARSLVHDEHLADDVVQSAYLATLEHSPPREVSPRAWFAGVVRNVAKMTLRGGARRKARERASVKRETAPSAEELVALAEQHHRLAALVVELEEPYRSTIVQRYFGGLEPAAIAARTGEPAATVRSRLKRGLDRLRARLEQKDGDSWRTSLLPLAAGPAALPGATTVATTSVAIKVAAAVLLLVTVGVATWRVVPWGSGAAEAAVPPSRAATPSDGDEPAAGSAPRAPVVLEPRRFADAAATVTGRVVDSAGAPVAGARVTVFPPDIDRIIEAAKPDEAGGPARSGVTDAFGRFEIAPGRASGLVNLFAEHRGHSPAILEHRDPSDDLLLVLEAGPVIAGRVTGPGGAGVAGARIRWHAVVCGAMFVREALADRDGAYQLSDILSEAQGLSTSQPPAAEVVVTAEGYGNAYLVPPAADESGTIRLDAVLPPGLTLSGTVVDAATSSPLAGAKVAFWTQREPRRAPGSGGRLLPDPMPVKGLSETTTDAAGRFRLTQLTSQGHAGDGAGAASGAFGVVGAIAPGYGAAIRTVSLESGSEVVLACRAGGRIRGQVVDASGRGLADVPVWLEPRVDSHHTLPPVLATERGSVITGLDGAFTFDGVRCDSGESAALDLVARPRATLGVPFRHEGIRVRAGETTDVGRISVGTVARLGVLVTDAAGAPIFGARVALAPFVDGQDVEGQSVATDTHGRATIQVLEPSPGAGHGIARVFAQHPGYARGSAFPSKEQDEQDLRIILNPEHVLRGRVCDDGGAPVVGAQVWLVDARIPRAQAFMRWTELEGPQDRLPAKYAAVVTSRAEGRFFVPGLAYHRFHVAARRSEGWSREPVQIYDVEADGTELVVKLPPAEAAAAAGDLEVAVSDAFTSHPVMGARVVAYTPARGDLSGAQALGVHRFSRLPAGVYTVTVQARGYAEQIVPDVEVARDSVRSLALKLERGVTVRGTVARADGLPFVNAEIGFVGNDPVFMPPTHPVEQDGRFAAYGLVPSREYVVVVVEHGPVASTVFMLPERGRVALPVGKGELNLRVMPGGVVTFLLGEDRDALRGVRLVVTNDAGVTVVDRTSPYKTVVPVSLPPGTYRASIERDGVIVDQKPFSMSVGDAVDVTLTLR